MSSSRFLYTAVVLVCGACFGRGNVLPPEPRATDKNVKQVLAVREYSSRPAWQRSGYSRIGQDEPISLPVFVAIAEDRTVCILDGPTWASLRPHQLVACRTPWRMWRS